MGARTPSFSVALTAVGGACLLTLGSVTAWDIWQHRNDVTWASFAAVWIIIYVLALIPTSLLLFLQSAHGAKRKSGLTSYVVFSTLIGALYFAFVNWFTAFPGGSGFDQYEDAVRSAPMEGALFGGALGGLASLFFCLIRRPDRDAPANPDATAP
jgi:hypothetical protein